MADSPSPVPESGLTSWTPETTEADLDRLTKQLSQSAIGETVVARLVRDLTAAMQEIERLRSRTDDTTWFWRIVDQDGLNNVPSDEVGALSRLVAQAARAESAEASARSARAEALAALEPFALVAAQCDEHYDNPDHYSPTIEDFRRAHAAVTAIRSLKTAPKGDGEANADDTAPARQP